MRRFATEKERRDEDLQEEEVRGSIYAAHYTFTRVHATTAVRSCVARFIGESARATRKLACVVLSISREPL